MTILFTILIASACFILGLYFKQIKFKIIKFLNRKAKDIVEEGINDHNNQGDTKNINKDKQEQFDFDDAGLKMVFLVREDLKLGAGKIAAQVAHAAVGLFDEISQNGEPYYEQALEYWNEFGSKKIVLRAKDITELKEVHKLCKKAKIPSIMISDAGHTQVDPGTVTVLGIGPEIAEKLDKITGTFKLMR